MMLSKRTDDDSKLVVLACHVGIVFQCEACGIDCDDCVHADRCCVLSYDMKRGERRGKTGTPRSVVLLAGRRGSARKRRVGDRFGRGYPSAYQIGRNEPCMTMIQETRFSAATQCIGAPQVGQHDSAWSSPPSSCGSGNGVVSGRSEETSSTTQGDSLSPSRSRHSAR